MAFARLRYRSGQFFAALFSRTRREELAFVREILSPSQYQLFQKLQASEQAHAIRVMVKMIRLSEGGGKLPVDVLAAGLLHDIGKIKFPLNVVERVMNVIGYALFPKAVSRWGDCEPEGLYKPFVVAKKHANWGAELAAACPSSPLTISLIRRHQEALRSDPIMDDERWLALLQMADDAS